MQFLDTFPIRKKAVLIFCAAVLLYLPSFGNQFVWDDEQFIYKNAYVRTFNIEKIFTTSTTAGAGVPSDYYRPLTTLSFAIDHTIWGLLPIGFHLTNTLMHASAAVLLYLLLRKIGLPDNPKSVLTPSWLVALLFAIHPIQTEAVVYMNSRGDSFYTLLGFATLLLLTHLPDILNSSNNQKWQVSVHWSFFFALILALYLLSILAKEIGISIVGIASLLILWKWWTHQRDQKAHAPTLQQYVTIAGMWAVAGGYLLARATILNFQNSFNLYGTENIYTQNLHVRLLTFSQTLWTYWRLLFIPHPLHMERNQAVITSPISIGVGAIALIAIVTVATIIFELRTTKKPWFTLGAAWFFGGLVPVSGILPINGILYEHWLYVPMVGFFIALYGAWVLLRKYFNWVKRAPGKILSIILISWMALLSVKTIHQNWLWRSPISLYTHLLNHTESGRIYNNLAMAYSEHNRQEAAIKYYQKAIEYSDIYPQTHYNLGNVYRGLGETEQAFAEYQRAVTLDPGFLPAHGARIELAQELGELEIAAGYLEEVSAIYENSVNVELLQIRQKMLTNTLTTDDLTAFKKKYGNHPLLLRLLEERNQ